jgi:hypothetical protein
MGCSAEPESGALHWARERIGGDAVEVDARWPALRGWSQLGEMQVVGMHAGGSFAALALPEAGSAGQCAAQARGAGARVIAPRRLRDAGPAWEAMGAAAPWQRLIEALGVDEAAP